MSKRKIGIITLNGYFNFGNRLQNYALTKVLEKKEFDVYTIWRKNKIEILKDIIKSNLFFIKKYKRFSRFYRFSKKNMKEILNESNLDGLDYFVVGSDQVWNYKLIDKDKTWFFARGGKKTISYSASLGTAEMPLEFKEKFYNMIKDYDAISVREKSGESIINSLGYSREIKTLIDPTMLLDIEDWNECIKNVKLKLPKKYIFVYFLGNISIDYKIQIEKFAKSNNCEIINILDEKNEFYDAGPMEFVYLIKNSFMVCTDSFHASVFSFLFDIPFVIFKRFGDGISNDLYTRLENLIKTFQLENREFNGIEITLDNLNNDYSKGHKILIDEKKKSHDFLDRNLIK